MLYFTNRLIFMYYKKNNLKKKKNYEQSPQLTDDSDECYSCYSVLLTRRGY